MYFDYLVQFQATSFQSRKRKRRPDRRLRFRWGCADETYKSLFQKHVGQAFQPDETRKSQAGKPDLHVVGTDSDFEFAFLWLSAIAGDNVVRRGAS